MADWHSVHALVNTNHAYRPSTHCALILSPDPLGAALVGGAVEVAGVRATFASPGESPRTALRRLRPTWVLIAADDPSIRDDAFLGPAKMTGARLLVFGREPQLKVIDDVVSRFGLDVLPLPRDAAAIGARLREASGSSLRQPESTAP